MNLPDITLFFQMLHFMVAYIILRKLVFAPALIIIEGNERRQNQLLTKIDGIKLEQYNLVQQCQQRWKFIQLSLIGMVPKLAEKVCVNPVQISKSIEHKEVKLTVDEKNNIKNMLEKELSDVEL
jgi:hypothetical protein